MSGCGRERGINVVNKKLEDFSHPMNLFSIRYSPCSDTSRQLQCTNLDQGTDQDVTASFNPMETDTEADLFPDTSHLQLHAFPFFTPFWTFQNV